MQAVSDSEREEGGRSPAQRETAEIGQALNVLIGHRTQTAVQEAAGLADKALSKFLNGRQTLSLEQLLDVGRALGLGPVQLLIGLGRELARLRRISGVERELNAIAFDDHAAALRALRLEVERLERLTPLSAEEIGGLRPSATPQSEPPEAGSGDSTSQRRGGKKQ